MIKHSEFIQLATPQATIKAMTVFTLVLSAMPSTAQDTSPFIDSVPVSSSWQDVTASEGNNLRIDYQALAYSGGGTANGRTVVFGGGHNNGMSDAVAFLDWRRFETVGWVEELPSTADHIGVDDFDFAAIGRHLNQNYNPQTPGGILDSRGAVALSRHTYDQIVVRDDHFYMFAGVLPYDNPGQPSEPWANDEGDIWRYDFGSGWTFVDNPIAKGYTGHASAAQDTLTGDIWVHDGRGLRRFDTTSETMGGTGDFLNSQNIESFMNFNSDKGAEGTLFGAGNYAGQNWSEYDIATGQQRNMGRVPGNAGTTYIIYVDDSYGANYGTYFALVPADGTLKRWNGSGWDTIATGAPGGGYVYGRAGFEPVHQVFYWVNNSYSGNNTWKTFVVRPYPYDGSVSPLPSVSLDAEPSVVVEQGMSMLTWSTTNADSCTASGDWSGSKSVTGSQSIGPLNNDTTYSLSCSGPGGTSSGSVSVTIQAAEPAPSLNLGASDLSIDSGEMVTLDWSSSSVDSCEARQNWSGSKPPQGSETLGPLTESSTFVLECMGPGGTITDSVSINVAAAPSPPSPPSPPIDPPIEPEDSASESSGGGGIGLPLLLLLLAGAAGRARLTRG